MRISNIQITNFRLLQKVSLSLEEKVTVIVGRNNSGKTSLAELFRRILNEKTPSFQLEDFSCAVHESFLKANQLRIKGSEPDIVRNELPYIEVRIAIEYTSDASEIAKIADFLIDLDPNSTSILLEIRYELEEGTISQFFDECDTAPGADLKKQTEFFKLMQERIPNFYKTKINVIDPKDDANRKKLEWQALSRLVRSGFINAQRWLDDTTHRENDVLGKVLESLFKTAQSDMASNDDKIIAKTLNNAVEGVRAQLDGDFNKHVGQLLPALSIFGYPGLTDPGLRTETILDVQRLLVSNTKVRYAAGNSVNLPESYNGLGSRNLIFILLQLFEFFKAYKAEKEMPGIQVVFIEEPEAHLHPQMAEVFIRKISDVADVFARDYNNGIPWPVQFVISTHSSHLANEARFETIRYFLATTEAGGNHMRKTRIKDLRKGMAATPEIDRDFLHQYMTLTRCDLFFADKAILVEGCSERLLLPKMINKIDSELATAKLSSQYTSIIEVCGAYAHKFFPLLEFLELRTLVITDIDSAEKVGGKSKKCRVAQGTHTTNSCIKSWFTEATITPAALLTKTNADKLKELIRLAYQIPETPGKPCGRTFEDAFILANLELFELHTTQESEQAEAADGIAPKENKAEFALEYAFNRTEWKIPLYIAEGLKWLSENPGDAPPNAASLTTEVAATVEVASKSKPKVAAKKAVARPAARPAPSTKDDFPSA